MSDLVAFLLARIAEDEADAGVQDPDDQEQWRLDSSSSAWPSISPSRVLAECESKRRIMTAHTETRFTDVSLRIVDAHVCIRCHARLGEPGDWEEDHDGEWGYPLVQDPFPCDTIRALALPYADHPDYREEWRPE